MRKFTSYGPAEPLAHYYVERRALVEQCVEQLIGRPEEKGGHYFTIWGPRQTGKTWMMRRAVEEIRARYGDQYLVGIITLQGIIENDDDEGSLAAFLSQVPDLIWEGFDIKTDRVPQTPAEWVKIFAREDGVFDRPVILLLDEFDSLPPQLIDQLVASFRKMYLARDRYWLHGLALIGVRSVLGLDSPRGSPFNVQRSLQVTNLTRDEVVELFRQYQEERGQIIEADVVNALYESTRGQPGLVGWFGELLTEKYNEHPDKPIGMPEWNRTYGAAVHVEWNNTLLNLGKKARGPYRAEVLNLFTNPNVTFSMEEDWCSYLYMNGIIDKEPMPLEMRSRTDGEYVCRFSSPFVQRRLYINLTSAMFGDRGPILPLEILDDLEDVFTVEGIDTLKLLERYRGYLKRLKAKGIDPWIGQPRRQDLHYTEAVGHFHLYSWLRQATVAYGCRIAPEFPTGNGKVDLFLQQNGHTALIEVKSFRTKAELKTSRKQAANYARKLGLKSSTLVVFAPTDDDAVLEKLRSDDQLDDVRVLTVPFGWV
jgi:hypothetical protein